MYLKNLARSAPVRYAVAFASACVLIMGVLLLVNYLAVVGLLDSRLEETVQQRVQLLKDDLAEDGRDAMLGLVGQHAVGSAGSPVRLLVLDAAGKRIAGDLAPIAPVEGWQDVAAREPGDDDSSPLRAFGAWLDKDTFLLVAHETEDLEESRELVLESFAWALGLTVALALGGGFFIGITLLGRVDAAVGSARAIMEGDLTRRIPVSGRDDELDRLAGALNRMLGRIQELMDNLRHVTSDVAHDLRTPLGRLRQRLEAARSKPRSGAEYEAVIDRCVEDTDGLIKTFDAVLRIAQIESRARRERFAPVDLSAVVDNVCDAYAAVAEDTGRRLTLNVPAGVMVQGDRELITQMLVNLVENALRHTPEGTAVEVGVVERRRTGPCLSVADTGPGIPADERERVLRRFYRLDRSRSTPGSGLGLSLVAAVARLHEASVVLQDNEPGLRVRVEFPPPASR